MRSRFKLSDSVLARIVQIVQEGMMLGIDVSDLMRMIELQSEEDEFGVNTGNLVLTPEYKASVDRMHEEYLERAKTLKQEGN